MPLLLMVIFRKVEPLDGAGLQLAKRHQGRRRVGEEMAAGDRIALDADDAPVDAAAHPVGGHAEMGGDFRHAEPARYGVTTRSVKNRTLMSLSDHPCLLEPF